MREAAGTALEGRKEGDENRKSRSSLQCTKRLKRETGKATSMATRRKLAERAKEGGDGEALKVTVVLRALSIRSTDDVPEKLLPVTDEESELGRRLSSVSLSCPEQVTGLSRSVVDEVVASSHASEVARNIPGRNSGGEDAEAVPHPSNKCRKAVADGERTAGMDITDGGGTGKAPNMQRNDVDKQDEEDSAAPRNKTASDDKDMEGKRGGEAAGGDYGPPGVQVTEEAEDGEGNSETSEAGGEDACAKKPSIQRNDESEEHEEGGSGGQGSEGAPEDMDVEEESESESDQDGWCSW